MQNPIRGDILVLNNHILPANEHSKIPTENVYYEVVRMIDGKFAFLDDHLRRLRNSCQNANINCPDKFTLIRSLTTLTDRENIKNGNAKIVLYKKNEEFSHACYFVPHKYPSDEDYQIGVKLASYQFERPDPNVKKWNENFRQKVNAFIHEENIYEAVLISHEGYLTEGSRSNIFFTDSSGTVWSSPTEYILPGITRKYVYQICKNHGITIREKLFSNSEISHLPGCFISGTSPKILPVKSLDQIQFSVPNDIITTIMKAYDKMLNQ